MNTIDLLLKKIISIMQYQYGCHTDILCGSHARRELLEYKLLYFFMTHPNKTYTRDQLINNVYGINIYIDDRTINVQIKRLREKLRPYGIV